MPSCPNFDLEKIERNVNEITCTRSVSGASFTAGVQDFILNVGAPSAFKWSDVYFRLSVSLTTGTDQPSVYSSDVALSDNFVNALFNQIDVKAGGTSISSQTRYVAQAAQLRTRICKSYAWQQSVGRNTFFIEPSYEERKLITSYDDGLLTNQGTITVDAGGLVAGTGTNFWNDGVRTGMILTVGGKPYVISSIMPDSELSLLIQVPDGFTPITTGSSYTINTEIDRKEPADGRNQIYVLWRPSLGIFDVDDWIGAGQYMVSLNPNTNYESAAIQTIVPKSEAGDYRLTVNDIRMYVPTYKVAIPDDVSRLSFVELDVQSKVIGVDGNVSSMQFTVPSSTHALALFLQSGEAGYDTINPPTLFRTKISNPPSTTESSEKSLRNLQITYAGISRPAINWANNEFTEDNTVPAKSSTNQLQQRYYDTITESGMIDNIGGVESFSDYLSRGPFYYYQFVKAAGNLATDVQLSALFGEKDLPANTRLFLVAFYSKAVEVTTQAGLVVNIQQSAI